MSQNIPTINRLGDCSQVVADYSFDVSGLFCPEPVMLLHKEIKNIKEGEVVEIDNDNKYHSVQNNSDIDRIHLLVDWLDKDNDFQHEK